MAADVIALRDYRPYAKGEAICLDCKHTWHHEDDIGAQSFDCPSCGSGRGVWHYPFSANVGEQIFSCNCGSEYFFITTTAVKCAKCGVTHKPFE